MRSLDERVGWLLAGLVVIGISLVAVASSITPAPQQASSEVAVMTGVLPGMLPPQAQQDVRAEAPEFFRAAEREALDLVKRTKRELVRCRVPLPPHTTLHERPDSPGALWSGRVVLLAHLGETQRALLNEDGAPIGHLAWQATPTGHACTWMRQ